MIDTTFDFRVDARGGDPDRTSPTLRQYHKILWSKPLPNGREFQLDVSLQGAYLRHGSDLGEYILTSDSIIHTYSRWKSMQHIVASFSQGERDAFMHLGYTIGGFILFPGNRIGGMATINGARGMNRSIGDRFDLTLESIRRFYCQQTSPLHDVLSRYAGFFALFGDFRGYVSFFLLEDLVQSDTMSVKFWMPFNNFDDPPVPQNLEQYLHYRNGVIEFVNARNKRIERYCKS